MLKLNWETIEPLHHKKAHLNKFWPPPNHKVTEISLNLSATMNVEYETDETKAIAS